MHSDIKEKDKLVNKDNAKYNPDEEIIGDGVNFFL